MPSPRGQLSPLPTQQRRRGAEPEATPFLGRSFRALPAHAGGGGKTPLRALFASQLERAADIQPLPSVNDFIGAGRTGHRDNNI